MGFFVLFLLPLAASLLHKKKNILRRGEVNTGVRSLVMTDLVVSMLVRNVAEASLEQPECPVNTIFGLDMTCIVSSFMGPIRRQ